MAGSEVTTRASLRERRESDLEKLGAGGYLEEEGGGLSRGTLLNSAETAGVGVVNEEIGVVLIAGVEVREAAETGTAVFTSASWRRPDGPEKVVSGSEPVFLGAGGELRAGVRAGARENEVLKESPPRPNERPLGGSAAPGEEKRLAGNGSGCFFCSAIVDTARDLEHAQTVSRGARLWPARRGGRFKTRNPVEMAEQRSLAHPECPAEAGHLGAVAAALLFLAALSCLLAARERRRTPQLTRSGKRVAIPSPRGDDPRNLLSHSSRLPPGSPAGLGGRKNVSFAETVSLQYVEPSYEPNDFYKEPQ